MAAFLDSDPEPEAPQPPPRKRLRRMDSAAELPPPEAEARGAQALRLRVGASAAVSRQSAASSTPQWALEVAALSTTAAQALPRVRARVPRKAPPIDRTADIIARLAEPQRDELVVQQLKRLEPGTYARLLREGAARLGREEVRAAAGAADVYVPGGAGGRRQSWVWRHAYLLRSCPGQSFCRRRCPLTPEGVPTERAMWLAGGAIGHPKSRSAINLANHLRTHGQALRSRL